jgi:hypothetical protein
VSKKADARIARALENQLKKQEKSARLVEGVKADTPAARTIRLGVDPSQIYQMHMDWSDADADRLDLGSKRWEPEAWDGVIARSLRTSRQCYGEIEAAASDSGHYMHHSMAIEVICDECQRGC